jgi:hypothetical protein
MSGNRGTITRESDLSTRADEVLAHQCVRCGAVSTHYLTCPSLQLPTGYRLSEDPGRSAPVSAGQQRVTYRASLALGRYRGGPTGGPDHPDWPRPPQH